MKMTLTMESEHEEEINDTVKLIATARDMRSDVASFIEELRSIKKYGVFKTEEAVNLAEEIYSKALHQLADYLDY